MVTEISNWTELDAMRNDKSADYILVNDLDKNTSDYTGIGDDFNRIGDDNDTFDGSLDGDGYEIRDLVIDLQNPDVRACGLIASGFANIDNLGVIGEVTADTTFVGIISGRNATFTNCYVGGSVSGNSRVATLGGQANAATRCFSFATHKSGSGGGFQAWDEGTFTDCYMAGSIESGVDGFIPDGGGSVTDCYLDTEASGTTNAGDPSVTTLTTSEMQGSEAQSNMNFDFVQDFVVVESEDNDATADGYPILDVNNRANQLRAQGIYDPFIVDGELTVAGQLFSGATVTVKNYTRDTVLGVDTTDQNGFYSVQTEDIPNTGDRLEILIDAKRQNEPNMSASIYPVYE